MTTLRFRVIKNSTPSTIIQLRARKRVPKITDGLLRTHTCGELRIELVGEKVTLCGWVNKYRNLGKLHFLDLRDKYGLIQLSFAEYKGDLSNLKKCTLESTLRIVGMVAKRPKDAISRKMKTGEVEVLVESLEILGQCNIDSLPFLPYGQIEATEELRLKYRYLDLRTTRLQKILKSRSDITAIIRQVLRDQEFVEVETPILYKSTPEGARDYIVPSGFIPERFMLFLSLLSLSNSF